MRMTLLLKNNRSDIRQGKGKKHKKQKGDQGKVEQRSLAGKAGDGKK